MIIQIDLPTDKIEGFVMEFILKEKIGNLNPSISPCDLVLLAVARAIKVALETELNKRKLPEIPK